MELFDTHAHLDADVFDPNRDEVVSRAIAAGVSGMICVGTTAGTSQKCLRIAEQYSNIRAAVGIQPNYCHQATPDDWDSIVQIAAHRRVAALGETGLDRYWDDCPLPIQQDYFDRHLRLSQAVDLPFIVHMRNCDEDVLQMLREARQRGPLRGVMHSFTGSESTARECLELGLYLSFAGMITYKKSDELRRIASQVPFDQILIETDSPYLSPDPHRAQRPNEPALIVHTAIVVAELQRAPLADFASQTLANTRRLFAV